MRRQNENGSEHRLQRDTRLSGTHTGAWYSSRSGREADDAKSDDMEAERVWPVREETLEVVVSPSVVE